MSNKTYDILKATSQIYLPLFATFYTTIGEIWGLPMTHEIAATMMALDTLLGGILMKISSDYNKEEEHE